MGGDRELCSHIDPQLITCPGNKCFFLIPGTDELADVTRAREDFLDDFESAQALHNGVGQEVTFGLTDGKNEEVSWTLFPNSL